MTSKVFLAVLAGGMIPCFAGAQQSPAPSPQPAGVQAQGNAAAQGSAQVERSSATAVQSQSSAAGNASGSVSKGDKSVNADGGAATNAVLAQSLDSKKAKPGDPVTAKTTEPASTPDHGSLPKGTKLLGHVTDAKAAGSGEGQSMLGFTFDRAVLKDGREVPIHSTVRALAAAEGAASAGSEPLSTGNPGGGMGGGGLGGATSAVGGLGATAGGALGGAANGAGRLGGAVTGSAGSTLGASGRALKGGAGAIGGVDARGLLSSDSQGVFGMKDVALSQSATGGGSAMITSASRNVHLDSGTRMLLTVEGSAMRAPAATGEKKTSGPQP